MKMTLENKADRLFGKILRDQAADCPDKPFLVTESCSISFAEAEAQTNCLAAGLADLGLSREDRVVLLLSNRPELVLLTLAANKLSAVWVPINADYGGEWLLDSIVGSKPTVIVSEPRFAPRLAEIKDRLPPCKLVMIGDSKDSDLPEVVQYEQLLEHAPLTPDYSRQDYGDTCAILWMLNNQKVQKFLLYRGKHQ